MCEDYRRIVNAIHVTRCTRVNVGFSVSPDGEKARATKEINGCSDSVQ